MNNHHELISKILSGHSVSSLFNINVINYSAGKIVLGLSARTLLLNSEGSFGCIMDCVARIAGYEFVGDSFVSEYELNSYVPTKAENFVARAQVDVATSQHATYTCDIFSVNNEVNTPLVQSHGTLIKINS